MIPLSAKVVMIHQQEGFYVVEKPSGVRSHPNKPGVDSGALLALPYDLKEECYVGEGGKKWYLCNRLDAPTSGLLVLSDDEAKAKLLKAAFANREVKKGYVAVVHGRYPKRKDVWRDRLKVRKEKGSVRGETGEGSTAITEVECLQVSKGVPVLSLLRLHPKTGRTHQLRIQSAHRRFPIIGDATYGDFGLNRRLAKQIGTKRLFLHSQEIQFRVVWNGKTIQIRAKTEIPETFRALVD